MENNFKVIRKNDQEKTIDLGIGKVPPNVKEIETIVLGAVMIEKEALAIAIETLESKHFYVPKHELIFDAIFELFNASQPIDIITVTEQLKKIGTLDSVGGSYYLVELTAQVSNASNIESYCKIIVEKAIQRELINIASKIATDAFDETTDVFELLDTAEKGIFGVTEGHLKKNYEKMSDLILNSLKQIEQAKEKKETTGVKSHYHELDLLLGGFQPSDLIILAARPSVGKTAFALNIARNVAVDGGGTVAIFSLEMSSDQLITRLISSEAQISSRKLIRGEINDEEYKQLTHNLSKLEQAKIFIDDTASLSTFELRAKCRRIKTNHDLKLILVDYLQLMSNSSSDRGTREQEISSISRSIKSLAKELEVPIITLSQLSRNIESRVGEQRKPRLSDLRESGAIEQDADVVMFIHRDDFRGITEDENNESTEGQAEILVRKHRNGPTGEIMLRFEKEYTKFEDFQNMKILGSKDPGLNPSRDNSLPNVDPSENRDDF